MAVNWYGGMMGLRGGMAVHMGLGEGVFKKRAIMLLSAIYTRTVST
jgi:hypothetical protein